MGHGRTVDRKPIAVALAYVMLLFDPIISLCNADLNIPCSNHYEIQGE